MIRVHHQPLQPPLLLSSTMSNIMKAWIVGCLLLMSLPDGKHGQQITNDDQSICLQRFAKFNRKHTACVGPNRNCRISKQGITEEEKKLILDVHNYYRNLIASGNESGLGFPSAANMLTLEWDDELAYVAQKHANQCRFEHDCYDCRRTERYPVVGQNLYTYRTTRKSVEPEWRKTIKNWYEEIKIAPPQVASSFDLFQLNIGHFTQIAWAETNRIGCGYSTYQPNDGNPRFKTEQLYTCNYAPGGNYLGEKMYENGRSASKCPPQYGPARQFQALCEYIAWSSTNSNVDDGNNNNNNIDNGFRNFDEQPPPPPVSSSSATETRSNNGGGNISSTRTITTSTSRTNSNRSRTTGTGTRTSNRNNRNRNRSRTTSTSTTTSTTTTSTTTSSTTNNNNNNDNRNRNRSTNNNTNNNNNNSNNRNRIATSDRRKNNNSNNNNNNSGGRIGSVGGTSRWSSRLNNWKNNSTSSSISATWDWKWNDSAYDWKKWLTNYTQFTNWTKWSPNANGNTGYGNNNIISNNNRPRSTIITTNNNINNNQQSPTTLSSPDQYTTSTGIPVIVVGSVGSNNNNDNNFNSNNNVPWRLTNATWWGNLTQTTNIQNLPKQRITTRLPTYTWALSLGYQKDGNNVAQPQWSRSVDLTPNYANANLYRQYSNWNWNNNNNNNNWNNRYYSNYY